MRRPSPLKRAIARALCAGFVGRMAGSVFSDCLPSRDCIIDTQGPITAQMKASILWGFYESAEIRFVRRYLRSSIDVVELGSSLGVVSAHIAKQLSPERRLLCVEANPALLASIQRNVLRNGPRVRLSTVHGAIDYSGRASVAFSIAESNIDSKISAGSTSDRVVDVPTVQLGRLLADNEFGEFALVCDIEGAEVGLFERDSRALLPCRQIIIELHETSFGGKRWSVSTLHRVISERGFATTAQHGPVFVFDRLG